MRAIGHLRALLGASHYHHPGHAQVNSNVIREGVERVEIVTGGRGWLRHRGAWREVLPGDLLWHVAGDETIGRNDPAAPYRCLSMHFEVTPGHGRPVARLTRWDDVEEVRAFTREVVRAAADERFDHEVLAAYAYSRALYKARRAAHHDRTRELPSPLRRVLEAIDRRYAEALAIDDLAAVAGWSTTHLHARCRAELDATPHRLLIQRRLRAAREMLAASDLPVARVAAEAGFPTPANFSRSFHQAVGMTPTAYRHRHAGAGADA